MDDVRSSWDWDVQLRWARDSGTFNECAGTFNEYAGTFNGWWVCGGRTRCRSACRLCGAAGVGRWDVSGCAEM